jgi:hypothetical protein
MAVGCPSAACSVVSRSAPRLRAVSSTVVTIAWASAPQFERKPPVTFRCTTECRRACSDALFVGGTAASVIVQLRWSAGSREGGGRPRNAASFAVTRKSSRHRSC